METAPRNGPARCAALRAFAVALGFAIVFGAAEESPFAQSSADGHQPAAPRPLEPIFPQPLQPISATPSAPSMADPMGKPPPVYPRGPTAEQESVRQRRRPEFEPVGVELDRLLAVVGLVSPETARDRSSPLASFAVFPRLDLETRYESNLFRDSSSVSDTIGIVKPSLSIRSDWANHALEISTGGEIGRHAENASEDYEDVFAGIDGKLEWRGDVETRASARVARDHQKRGSLADPGDTSGVIEIETARIAAGATWETGLLKLSGDVRVESLNYVSTARRDNDDFDRTDYEGRVRASWEVDDGTSVFVQPRLYSRKFRRERDLNGLLQDNGGTEILAGLSWDASGVTFAELGVGYIRQTFEDPLLPTISGPAFNGRAVWNATDLMTLTLGISRTIEETNDTGFAGVVVTRFRSRLDYEFLYNTIVSARFDYAIEDYDSNPRKDDRIETAFEVQHLLNEYLFTGFELGYEKLSTNSPGDAFRNLYAAVRLGAQI